MPMFALSYQRALEVQWLWLLQLFLPCTLSSWTLGLPLALQAGHSSMAMMACSVGLFFCGKKKVSLSSQRALDVQWLQPRQLFLPCSLSSSTLGLPLALKAGPSSMAVMPCSGLLFFCGKKKFHCRLSAHLMCNGSSRVSFSCLAP